LITSCLYLILKPLDMPHAVRDLRLMCDLPPWECFCKESKHRFLQTSLDFIPRDLYNHAVFRTITEREKLA